MKKSDPTDIRPMDAKLHGFYRAVVEDNNDPLKQGRIKARVFGRHTKQKTKSKLEGIPTSELPWFEPCLPIIEGGISGFGMFGIPLKGSHVMVLFEDGNPLQGKYFASLSGYPKIAPDSTEGFNDPDGIYPTNQRLDEPDYHRLARGVTGETLVQTKNDQAKTGIQEAGGGSWDEPQSPYAAQYPQNVVFAMHGGVTVELDSTPNKIRLHLYHPSNSFLEIDNEGNMVFKNNKERYELTMAGKKVYIKDTLSESVDADRKVKVGNNEDKDIAGNFTIIVGGNAKIQATGTCQITCPTITLTGATTVAGLFSVTGNAGGTGGTMEGTFNIINGDVIADSISLKNHVHGGVDVGSGISGPPQ